MTEVSNPPLAAWETFYVIVGSSGAALIGVQFVVITLVATMKKRTTAASIGAFATPTVVHLGGALLVSALMSAPWHSLFPLSVALTTCGRSLPVHQDTIRGLQRRSRRARAPLHWNPQRMGRGDAHRHHPLRRRRRGD